MKLLIDQNLPRSLVREFEGQFPNSVHVRDLRFDTATDQEIFRYAEANEFTIVSKDNDFTQLSFLYGAPPKVVWLRVGNCTTTELKEIMRRNVDRVKSFEAATESVLLIEL